MTGGRATCRLPNQRRVEVATACLLISRLISMKVDGKNAHQTRAALPSSLKAPKAHKTLSHVRQSSSPVNRRSASNSPICTKAAIRMSVLLAWPKIAPIQFLKIALALFSKLDAKHRSDAVVGQGQLLRVCPKAGCRRGQKRRATHRDSQHAGVAGASRAGFFCCMTCTGYRPATSTAASDNPSSTTRIPSGQCDQAIALSMAW